MNELSPTELGIPLNTKRLRIRAIRFFLLLEIFFVGFPLFAMRDYFLALNELHMRLISLLLLSCVVFPFILFMRSKVSPQITFHLNWIEIPRFFFWVRRISNDSILSLEKVVIRGKDFGAVVGLKNGKIFNYDPKSFLTREDYTSFIQRINEILKQNDDRLSDKYIKVNPITWEHNFFILLFLGAWLFLYIYLTRYSHSDFYSALEIGAIVKNILSVQESYRLASAFFLHLNTFHLASNILCFAIFGQYMFRLVDRFRFLSIFLLSAFLSALATLFLSSYDAVIGASGGIIGLFGAYCCLRMHRYLPGSISSGSDVSIVFFIVLQIFLELFVEGFDSYSHAAGFCTGFIYMWVCLRTEKEKSIFASTNVEKLVASLLSIFYLTGLAIFVSKV